MSACATRVSAPHCVEHESAKLASGQNHRRKPPHSQIATHKDDARPFALTPVNAPPRRPDHVRTKAQTQQTI
jgi:hypothetical protein